MSDYSSQLSRLASLEKQFEQGKLTPHELAKFSFLLGIDTAEKILKKIAKEGYESKG